MNRGAFDFETFNWSEPFCASLVSGLPGNRKAEYILDPARTGNAKRYNPEKFAENVLIKMHERWDVKEWWAHNMGRFDGLILLAAAQRLNWSVGANCAGSRIVRLYLRPPDSKHSVMCLDSCALVPGSLANCASDFELPSRKLFTKEDYSQDARTWPIERLVQGCKTDSLLVLELIERIETLVQDWRGAVKATFSATALSVVKAALAEKGLEIPNHKKLKQLNMNEAAQSGYYGARVEVLHHLPQHALTEWDVCSSYPWAMAQNLPWEPLGDANKTAIKKMMAGKLEGMIQAAVKVPDMPYPPLPYRAANEGVYFPTGRWVGMFPACELRYARELGCTVKPLLGYAYTQASPFGEYVDKIYSLKSTAKGAVRNFAKLCLNGSYGKFGQKPESTQLKIFPTEEEGADFVWAHPNGECQSVEFGEYKALFYKTVRWHPYTHFPIAAYITALARMKLHEAMIRSKGLAYVDSDSIHAESLYDVAFGNGLGEWKTEIEKYQGEYFAPKFYRLTEPDGKIHLAAKGFPVRLAGGAPDIEGFKRMVAKESVDVERMQLMKSQVRGNKKFTRIKEQKRWHGLSRKRFAYKDGTTRPWTVQELQQRKHETSVSPALKCSEPEPAPSNTKSARGHRGHPARCA